MAEIEALTPWAALVSELEGYYPNDGRGRPRVGLERILRMYIAQQRFGVSDEGIEDAIYDDQETRRFVGIDLARELAPMATTLPKYCRLLERHELTERIPAAINAQRTEQGLLLREGTFVDATITPAPPLTENREKRPDQETPQTPKGRRYYFGMKAHIGTDAASGLVHSLVGAAANVTDITQPHRPLHGEEEHAFGNAAYQGVDKRAEHSPTPSG